MAKKTEAAEWNAQANFVFSGTVRKLKATTFEHLPVTDRTVIVRVEEAVRVPEMLEQYVGSEITVELSEQEKVHAGERAIFYTQSVMVGESLVVQSFGHVPATAAATSKAEADPSLHKQVANADMIVTGKVTSVRTLKPAASRSTRGSAAESFSPISEHDPIWQEAVIEVADVEKGTGTPKEIVVRFPASTDVQWHQAPKFQPGQEGVFLLSSETVESTEGKRTRGAKQIVDEDARYSALDPASFQPMQKAEAIRSLIRSQKS